MICESLLIGIFIYLGLVQLGKGICEVTPKEIEIDKTKEMFPKYIIRIKRWNTKSENSWKGTRNF